MCFVNTEISLFTHGVIPRIIMILEGRFIIDLRIVELHMIYH